MLNNYQNMNTFRDLKVWNRSMDLTVSIYSLCSSFPKSEIYGLVDQMKRSAVSIPSNIAEGNARQTLKDQIHFLFIARASCAELETQIEISTRLWFISKDDYEKIIIEVNEISRMIVWLIHSKK